MNQLFERLSLQGHLRRIIDSWGHEQGLRIIEQALQRELAHNFDKEHTQ